MTASDHARRPVMADVARLAGVSHQTVSRVLNDDPHVRASTRERVRRAISDLDYRRNTSARALVTRQTRILGVLAFDTTLYGPASTLMAIEQAARGASYFVSIVSLSEVDTASVAEGLDYLVEQSVDGVIVIAPMRAAAEAIAAAPARLPIVAVEGGQAGDLPVAAVDQPAGAKLATSHLLGLGHRTVHHVAGPVDWLEAEGRLEGWRASLETSGSPIPDPLRGTWSSHSGYQAGRVLARDADVTAVFVANDQMALGLLRALSEAGREVPGEVSVVGFDDIPEAAFFPPPLTTVSQNFAEVGRASIRLLLGQIHGDGSESGHDAAIVAPTLVVRDSTGPPRPGQPGPGRRSRRDQGAT